MKLLDKCLGVIFCLLFGAYAFAGINQDVKQSLNLSRTDSVKEIRAAKKVARRFAESHLLGTGGDQYVTDVQLISPKEAKAIIGDEEDKNAYITMLKKKGKGWVVFSYEYVFLPTGKKQIDTLVPPFPNPTWDRIIKQQ